jgi:acetyl-CoA acyltransferase 1
MTGLSGSENHMSTVSVNKHQFFLSHPLLTPTSMTSYIANKFKSGRGKVLAQHDDDVVVVAAVRSAITKAKKGGFKDTRPEEILSGVLSAVYKQVNLDPALIQDISVGNVLPPGGGASAARMAALHAGIPYTTPINTVNRQCSSGLSAINQIAGQIALGQIDIGIGTCIYNLVSFSQLNLTQVPVSSL